MRIVAGTADSRIVKFALRSVSDPLAGVSRISGFDPLIPTHSSRQEALAAVTGSQAKETRVRRLLVGTGSYSCSSGISFARKRIPSRNVSREIRHFGRENI